MRSKLLGLLGVLALLMVPAAAGAAPSDTVLAIESVNVTDYPKTTVLVSMPTELAKSTLSEDAFSLTEDGRPQDITVSEAATSDLQVLLLMDTTGSMGGEPIAAAKSAATTFIRQLPKDTSLSVMSYETKAEVESKFSTNKDVHFNAIRGLEASGETAMYDALGKALNQFGGGANSRRAVVMLTDGEDNSSKTSLAGITKQLAASGTTLYAVKYSTAFTDSAALRQMASATGGKVKRAEDSEALTRVYDEIATALVNQYELTYTSTGHGELPVSIEVTEGGVSRRARTVVQFPPAPVAPKPEPATAKVLAVDTKAYPEVTLTVQTPEQLSDQELGADAFLLLESEAPQELTAVNRTDGQTYQLQYLSHGHGEVELAVSVSSGAISAEARTSTELPPLKPGLIQSRTALLIGAGLCFLGLFVLLLILFLTSEGRARRGVVSSLGTSRAKRPNAVAGMADWATQVAERSLDKGNRRGRLNVKLEQAGVNLRPGEFIVLAACIAITAMVIGFMLLGGIFWALIAGAFSVVGCRAFLNFKAGRRRAKFANQLSDTLQLLSGSLRAGYSVLQAVDAVSREAESPTAEEFRRLVVETRLGRDLTEALQAMRERVGNEDFEWVVQAIGINREVGGDLAMVLDTVAHTIRERNQIRRQVKALSAEGKLSAFVLISLPFGVGFMIMMTNPGYLMELVSAPIGWAMLAMAALMMAVGTFWLSKIVRFKF